MSRVLMQFKTRGPYPNKWNGVGGKIYKPEDIDEINGAYRELREEAALAVDDVYPLELLIEMKTRSGNTVYAYYTKTKNGADFKQIEDETLQWLDSTSLLDVKDTRLAGGGEIPYFINFAMILDNY